MRTLLLSLALVVLAFRVHCAPYVIYQTGWEALPASPAWALGNVPGQNSWQLYPSGSGSADRVVANGTTDASVSGQAVTTPYGTQFHRFTASTSTLSGVDTFAWPDVTDSFAGRPSGFNTITCSMSVFVPSTQMADSSIYGFVGFDGATELFALFVEPDDQSVNLFMAGSFYDYTTEDFGYDQWFKLSFTGNYDTGDFSVSVNDTPLGTLVGNNSVFLGAGFTDLDMVTQNTPTVPNPRVIFTDNYRIEVAPATVQQPTLVISPISPNHYRLGWGSTFSSWVLEYASQLPATSWTTETATRTTSNGIITVDVADASAFRVYRLRQGP